MQPAAIYYGFLLVFQHAAHQMSFTTLCDQKVELFSMGFSAFPPTVGSECFFTLTSLSPQGRREQLSQVQNREPGQENKFPRRILGCNL